MAQVFQKAAISLLGRAAVPVDAIGATLWLAWTAQGLARVDWCRAGEAWADGDERGDAVPEAPLPPQYAAIADYLEDGKVDLSGLPVDLAGTPFQLRVWKALRAIPPGHLRTYAGLASAIGSPRAMRAVGMANARNPLPVVIPCHRVVETGHRLGGYSGGLDRKRFLLGLEGATIEGDQVHPGQLQLL